MQLLAMPVLDMIETAVLVKKLQFQPTTKLRFVTRNIYVGKFDNELTSTLGTAFCDY